MSNKAYLAPLRAPATCKVRPTTLTLNCGTGTDSKPFVLELLDLPLELLEDLPDFLLELDCFGALELDDFTFELDDFTALELDCFAEELDFATEELLATLEDDFTELEDFAEELDATSEELDSALEQDATSEELEISVLSIFHLA